MFCMNCGNKMDDKACVCLNCGVLVRNRSGNNVVKQKKKINTKNLGIVSVVLGTFSLILSFMLFFHDISSVGMYIEFVDRIYFALNYSITSIMLATVAFIFSIVAGKNSYGKIGLALSILSFFFIITEFIVVIIY